MNRVKLTHCQICERELDNPENPLSTDCGGGYWGCVGMFETEMGHPESLAQVRKELALGLRPG